MHWQLGVSLGLMLAVLATLVVLTAVTQRKVWPVVVLSLSGLAFMLSALLAAGLITA